MNTSRKLQLSTIITVLVLLVLSLIIKLISYYPNWIEIYYSRGIYPYISSFYRTLFGWIPFSIGDILYFLAGSYLLYYAYKTIKVIANKQLLQVNYFKRIKRTFYIVSTVYIYFNVMWGLNYNRPGIASQLNLIPQLHNEADLKMITSDLIEKVNKTRLSLHAKEIKYKPYQAIFNQAQKAYSKVSLEYPFMEYKTSSVKKSIYGRLGKYVGFLGYYNPFTGEAQLNLTIPQFLLPYVSCHEMAHQLGYASESEASFVSYLAAVHSDDSLFHYSIYFDLYTYANNELYKRDSVAAKNNYKLLDPLVKSDLKVLKTYIEQSKNPIEPIIKIFYDHYLKANQQSNGMNSYNEVVSWLIAYKKKYGKI